MIVTKKSLPRRTVLRGLGAAVALPMLDGMVPAFAAVRNTPAARIPRLGIVYVPNGQAMREWTPAVEGTDFEITPILKPLEAFRDRMLVVSGLDLKPAIPQPGDPGGVHGRCSGSFLTGSSRQGDRRGRLRGGHLDGPGRGEGARAGDAARVPRAEPRPHRHVGGL